MFCPFLKEECKGELCALYSTIYNNTCSIQSVEYMLEEILSQKDVKE